VSCTLLAATVQLKNKCITLLRFSGKAFNIYHITDRDRCISTIQEEGVVASTYQKWLPESATLIHLFHVHYVLFTSAIWLIEINSEEAKEVCIFLTCTWIFLAFRSFMSCSKHTTTRSLLHRAQVNFATCFLLPH